MSSVRKTRKLASLNEELLMKKTPTFFAYYPGEPYIYCDKANPDEVYVEVRRQK